MIDKEHIRFRVDRLIFQFGDGVIPREMMDRLLFEVDVEFPQRWASEKEELAHLVVIFIKNLIFPESHYVLSGQFFTEISLFMA